MRLRGRSLWHDIASDIRYSPQVQWAAVRQRQSHRTIFRITVDLLIATLFATSTYCNTHCNTMCWLWFKSAFWREIGTFDHILSKTLSQCWVSHWVLHRVLHRVLHWVLSIAMTVKCCNNCVVERCNECWRLVVDGRGSSQSGQWVEDLMLNRNLKRELLDKIGDPDRLVRFSSPGVVRPYQ